MYLRRMKKILYPLMALGMLAISPVQADDTPLAEQMEIVNDSYKALRRVDDAAEGVKLAREGQAAVLKGITMVPEFVEAGSHPDGKEKAMVAYKKQMAALYVIFCDAELACLNEDLEKIQELVDAFKDSKKKGHTEFMEE